MVMKQIIEIEVPDGKKAIWKDGTIVFEDIKPQLPKTWKEFCNMKSLNEFETYINDNSECIKIEDDSVTRRPCEDRNVLPSIKAAEAHLALMQLHQLRDCYRQGWTPNYTNPSVKFCIIRNFDYSRYFNSQLYTYVYEVKTYTTIPHFLSFQSKEIAEEFLNNFKDLIEQAGDLI